MCAVDISKAFDAINHVLLIEMISGTDLHPNLVRWLKACITGRKALCMYGSKTSSQFILRSGVPHGSVLSPAIFNFYVSDCLTTGDILESYAYDFSLLESDADLAALAEKLQISVDEVVVWAAHKKLTIAPLKSQLTLFTPWTKQVNTCPW
jgi:hypothetical protein